MKAILCERYGPPESLQLREVEKPTPKDNEVLLKVHAASVNALDWRVVRGSPFIVRLVNGLRKPKDTSLGADVAGRVEAVGGKVTRFQPGAEVFGTSGGSFAEYAVAREDRLASKPASLSFETVAAVPVAAITALQGLRDRGQVQPGQKVLINGAGGGVGTFAVQIAKSFGAEVTAVTNAQNMDLVRSLGADHVLDYAREDFTRSGLRYDLILDVSGSRSVSGYKRALTPHGITVVIGMKTFFRFLRVAIRSAITRRLGPKKIGMMMARVTAADLAVLGGLLESGKVAPVIDRRYPLSRVPEAIGYLESKQARGKVIINIQPAGTGVSQTLAH